MVRASNNSPKSIYPNCHGAVHLVYLRHVGALPSSIEGDSGFNDRETCSNLGVLAATNQRNLWLDDR
jgi:hypothetical protein